MTTSDRTMYSVSGHRLPIDRYNLWIFLFYFIVVYLCPFSATAEKHTIRIDKLVQQKQILARQLDSLDLLKQHMKRQGAPINDIEHNQNMLRDSIASLKASIQTLSEHTPAARPPSETFLFFPKPANLFDWIIVIVGLIATFSGLMLLAGVLRSIKARRKKARRQQLQQQYKNSAAPASPSSVYPQPIEPAYPGQPETLESQSTTNGQQPPLPDTGTIALLRERVKQQTPYDPRQSPQRPVIEKPVLPPESTEIPLAVDKHSLEQAILEAAGEGLDHAAISKKFHVSIDHIALLLKVADKKR